MTEIEKLKVQLKVAEERIDTLSSTNIALSNQIEKMKCCENCKHYIRRMEDGRMTEEELKKENEALKKTIENDALTKKVKIAAMKEIERLYKMEKDLTEKIHNSIPDEKILLMLEDILTYTDLCSVCEYYGQFQPHCKCLRNSECAKHILELFKDFQERIKIES